MAEFEGYLADASGEFEALEKKLSHNLERDLDHFSKDIKEMIAVEIIKRYYYQRGSIIQQLKDDDDLKEAAKILTAPEEYKKMLGAPLANRTRANGRFAGRGVLPPKIIIQKTQSPTESFHYSWTVQTGFREKKISLWDSASFVRKKELISQCNPRSF